MTKKQWVLNSLKLERKLKCKTMGSEFHNIGNNADKKTIGSEILNIGNDTDNETMSSEFLYIGKDADNEF